MSEPVNPLFEEEKEFLERKKLEYERALRGDVEQIKEQGVQLGRVALVGAGVVGGVWLLSKAFGGKKKRHKDRFEDEEYDDDTNYQAQHFADYDEDDEPTSQWPEHDAYFGGDDEPAYGSVYHSDTDRYDEPSANDADDDNSLSEYPDFPAHSGRGHGTAAGEDFQSEAYGHPESPLPFDDSRRLPEGDDFTEQPNAAPKRQLSSTLVAFAKSDFGKMLLGQAASVAIALVTKVVKERASDSSAETANTSDLAASTGSTDGYAHGHPATPQPAPDAYAAPADAYSHREPLA